MLSVQTFSGRPWQVPTLSVRNNWLPVQKYAQYGQHPFSGHLVSPEIESRGRFWIHRVSPCYFLAHDQVFMVNTPSHISLNYGDMLSRHQAPLRHQSSVSGPGLVLRWQEQVPRIIHIYIWSLASFSFLFLFADFSLYSVVAYSGHPTQSDCVSDMSPSQAES